MLQRQTQTHVCSIPTHCHAEWTTIRCLTASPNNAEVINFLRLIAGGMLTWAGWELSSTLQTTQLDQQENLQKHLNGWYFFTCHNIKKNTHVCAHTHTHTHTASSRPAAERLLQPSSLPPFEFSLLSFLIGCEHICKLFRGQHIYAGDQASSCSVVPIHSVSIHLMIAPRQQRGWRAGTVLSDREITPERTSRK